MLRIAPAVARDVVGPRILAMLRAVEASISTLSDDLEEVLCLVSRSWTVMIL